MAAGFYEAIDSERLPDREPVYPLPFQATIGLKYRF